MAQRRFRREGGASAVEFALVLPILILFIFGIVQFGLAFARTQGMEAAAREGARLASLGRDVDFSEVESAVRNSSVPFIDSGDIVVQVDGSSAEGWCTDTDHRVTVEAFVNSDPAVRARYAISIPLWPGESVPSYASQGTFRCEAPHA